MFHHKHQRLFCYDVAMNISLTPNTQFILSTSGNAVSIQKHNQALQAFDVDIVYFTFGRDISAEEYANLLKSPIVRGGAVTGQGLKTGVLPYITHLDPLADKLGSINTVVNNGGELYGYNTDAFGFKTAITKFLQSSGLQIGSAVVYGNGGVSGVAVRVLQDLGIKVGMAGRNQERVAQKTQELGLEPADGPYDLVVNATPISSKPVEEAEGLVPLLKSAKAAFDHSMPELNGQTNYLMEYCKANNLQFISGQDMYTPQLGKQWRLFLDGLPTKAGGKLQISEDDINTAWGLK